MSLDFGKLAFSVSFDPTSAFPLDARSYFESYEAAEAAAASAKPAGSTESVYYYGQTLVVFENNVATSYLIQPGKEGGILSLVCKFSSDQFEKKNNGELSLKGFDKASLGKFLRINNEEKYLEWVDSYTKDEIDSELSEVNQKLSALNHLSRKIVTKEEFDKAVQEEDAEQYIFMVETGDGDLKDSNHYDEYLIVEIAGSKVPEKIGSWEVNLENYVTKESYDKDQANITAALENAATKEDLKNYVTKEEASGINKNIFSKVDENKGLTIAEDTLTLKEDYSLLTSTEKAKIGKISDLENSVESLASLLDYQDKIKNSLDIRSTSNEFTFDNSHLSINKIEIDKVNGLQTTISSIQTTLDQMNGLSAKVSNLEEVTGSLSTRLNNVEQALLWRDLEV